MKRIKCSVIAILCISIIIASTPYTHAASRDTIIQGYACNHTCINSETAIFASTSATYSYGTGFPTITCKVTAKGIYDGTQVAENYGVDSSTGNYVAASCDVGSGNITFSSYESRAFFMAGLWSVY